MDSITELFCLIDDFYKEFEEIWKHHVLTSGQRKRWRLPTISLPEMMTLVVLFHQLRYRQFKMFYLDYAHRHLRGISPLAELFAHRGPVAKVRGALGGIVEVLNGRCTGLSIVDATPLAVCDNLRIGRHRVFRHLAARGKTSTGWFYRFKLHLVINHRGELLDMKLTPGNTDDRKPVPSLCAALFGKLYGDKGYIGKALHDKLLAMGVDLVTKVRKNMKPVFCSAFDQAILKRRSLIGTVIDQLKNLCQIEHTRHRSPINFTVNLLAGIVAYCLMPNKPSLPVGTVACIDNAAGLIQN